MHGLSSSVTFYRQHEGREGGREGELGGEGGRESWEGGGRGREGGRAGGGGLY